MRRFEVETKTRNCMVDITAQVAKAVSESEISEGIAIVYVPHTTAGIMINEGADPDVQRDILDKLSKLVPLSADYLHTEGNADAHIKSALVGESVAVPISSGRLSLGTWQKIFFCEFDGPRRRHFDVVCLNADRQ